MNFVLRSKFNSFHRVLSTRNLWECDISEKMKTIMLTVSDEELKRYFPDLPSGLLDKHRKKATFDWRRMKLSYENLNTIKLKVSTT